jgi:cell division protein FtsQ
MDRSLALPLRRPLSFAPSRRVILGLLAAALALPALFGGWLWLRDSSLVTVEHVQVSGVTRSPYRRNIEAALAEAARRMSTLHVSMGALRAAAAPYRVVRDLRVSAGFPHTLRIRVIEQPPVAALVVGGTRTAVAADGAVLGPALLSSSLPLVHGTAGDPLGSGSVHGPAARAALTILGAAPPTLAGWITRVYSGREGLTVAMRNGLLLYFGNAARPHAKWLSAARVLADSSSAGAWYVDVRLPERPAAGITDGVASGSAGLSGAAQVSASDPTAAALAATLAEAVNGGSGTSAAAPASTSSTPPAAAQGPGTSTQGSAEEQTGSVAQTGSETGVAQATAPAGGG